MSNLFKKGFASVALASAMASGVFAGNAAYIDVKVNYLSGMGKAVLGYNDTNETTNKRLDEVELLVSILDKDGNYATKSANGGSNIIDVVLDDVAFGATNRAGKSTTTEANTTDAESTDIISDAVITRAIKKTKNTHRFVIDYSFAEVAKLMDEVTITSGTGTGTLKRIVNIDLTTREARGLIVRATPNSSFKTERYINEEFSLIEILSEGSTYRLGNQSNTSPGGIAGVSIPLQVYASTDGSNVSEKGRFTFASNLEGKTIVVQALGDYNNNGKPSVVLNSVELDPMINGQASGKITITNAMPSAAFGQTIRIVDEGYGQNDDGGGLGIVLVAYVKEKQSITNYAGVTDDKIRDNTVMADFAFDTNITELGHSVDTIQVRSGEAVALKVGEFDTNGASLSKLWSKTSEIFNVSEGKDLGEVPAESDGNTSNVEQGSFVRQLTVVDSYGNPAIGVSGTSVVVKIDDELASGSNPADSTTELTQVMDSNVTAYVTAGDENATGVTTVNISFMDSNETNDTLSIKSQKLTIDASDGVLSNVKAKDLTLRTLPLIEVTKNGGPNWIGAIADINTTDAFADATDAVNFPLFSTVDSLTKANANDFTVVIKSGVADKDLKDSNATFRVFIKDESGEGEFLEGGDLNKYIIAISETNIYADFTVAGLFYNDSDTDISAKANTGTGQTKTGDGYVRFDFNSTGSEGNFTIEINSSATVNLASIVVKNFNAAKIKEEEIIINIPTYEDKYTASYVDVYMENVDDLKETPVGSVVNFKFTGSAVSTGDTVTIDMNSTGLGYKPNGKTNAVGRIGLVGSDISSNKNGKITTTLPENHIVSVVLYDANKTNKGFYGFEQNATTNAVTINGNRPVWLNLKDDDETDVLELGAGDNMITLRSKKDAISQIRIDGKTLLSPNDGDGTEDDKADSFNVDPDFMYDGMINGAANIVKTGLYYALFDSENDVILLDKYKNSIEGLKEDIGKDVTYTTTDGMEFKNNGSDGSWIKFKHDAAGTEQTLTLTRTKADGVKITKTITWTKITLSKLNTKFMVTTDSNGPTDLHTGAFDVVNSEVVVKVIGDGQTKQSSTMVKVTHSDTTATVRFVKVNGLKTQNLYTNSLVGATSSTGDVIQVKGNYYILSSDKMGTVTITATAKGKDSKGADITVSGTHTVIFDDIDLDKPVINTEDVKVANGQVTVIVQDANLDTFKTTVVVNDKDGKKVADGVYANGKYTAKVSSAGLYQIFVVAFDMAGNVQLDDDGKPEAFKFVRTSGAGAPSVEEEAAAMLIAKKEYKVAGTFTSYNFGSEKAKNWIYTDLDGVSSQLLAITPTDGNEFGFEKVADDVKPSTKNVWYMIRTGEGKFDWALADTNGVAYKLKGAKADHTFDFSGRLNLNVSHKDGMLTFTAK